MKKNNTSNYGISTNSKKRPGIHAKTKTSQNTNSKLYKKQYKGQGR